MGDLVNNQKRLKSLPSNQDSQILYMDIKSKSCLRAGAHHRPHCLLECADMADTLEQDEKRFQEMQRQTLVVGSRRSLPSWIAHIGGP